MDLGASVDRMRHNKPNFLLVPLNVSHTDVLEIKVEDHTVLTNDMLKTEITIHYT